MTTALQLIQQATAELGLPVPVVVAGSTATDTVQQLALLNATGYELQRSFIWQKTDKEYRFTTAYVTTIGNTTINSAVITNIPSTASITAGTYMAIGTGINQDAYVLSVDSATQVTLNQSSTATGTAVALSFCQTKYTMPSDFDRPIDRTQWDKSKHWEMLGPRTSQEWQWLKSGYIATGPRVNFRMLGGYFEIWPPLTSNEYIGFEYMSNAWAYSSASVAKTSITADTDTCIFPDRLMVLGLKMKYFEIKGFDASAFTRDFLAQLDIAKANDAGSKTLSMAPRLSSILLTEANVPDSGYGL
jgi:hypothetical protein